MPVGWSALVSSKRMEELKSVLRNYTSYQSNQPMLAWEFEQKI